ncbi:hypothetical protein MHW47_35060, partial [Streptomyces sp. OfavH-34-F]|nr:hypothetical protein [Streptomyces sp. OfavH-34-F]
PIIEPLIEIIGQLAGILATGLATVITDVVVPVITAIVALLQGNFGEAWELAKTAVSNAAELVGEAVGKLAEWVGNGIGAAVDWIKGLPGRAWQALSPLAGQLRDRAASALRDFKDTVVTKAGEVIAWARGLPGRIGEAIGDLGSLLVDKGKDVVRGLYEGVKSMGGWLKDKLSSFASSMVPGPIADALGIASPSKVMARDIGRWIPAGVVKGVESGKGAVDRAMRSLVTPPAAPQLTPAGASLGAYSSPFAPAGGGAMVQIEHWHAAEHGTPEQNAESLAWLAKARG